MHVHIFILAALGGVLQHEVLATLHCSSNSISNAVQSWNGYDITKSDVWGTSSDDGIRGQIFEARCDNGYYDFVTVQKYSGCEATFQTKVVTSLKDYLDERSGSDEWGTSFSREASAEATIYGVTVGMDSSVSFATRQATEYEESYHFFETTQGEISLSDIRCSRLKSLIYIDSMRPKFKRPFINHLTKVDELLGGKTSGFTSEQQNEMAKFIDTFGTHFAESTDLGARLMIEERFGQRSTTETAYNMRATCNSYEFNGCFGASVGYADVASVSSKNCAGYDEETCRTETNNELVGTTSSERNVTVRAVGTTQIDYTDMLNTLNDDNAMPIGRDLVLISELFTESNLAESVEYQFSRSLNAEGLKNLFLNVVMNYCTMVYCRERDSSCPSQCIHQWKGCGLTSDCQPEEECENNDSEKGYECKARSNSCKCDLVGSVNNTAYTCEDHTKDKCGSGKICYESSFDKTDVNSACRTPPTNCAKMYMHSHEGASDFALTVENGDIVNNVKDKGSMWNDAISRVDVEPGCFFAGYKHDKFGEHMFTQGNVEGQSVSKWSVDNSHSHNDEMTSYSCHCSKVCAILYRKELDDDDGGDQLPIPEGWVTKVKDTYKKWNDAAKSIYVAPNCKLQGFNNDGFREDLGFSELTGKHNLENSQRGKLTSWKCSCKEAEDN